MITINCDYIMECKYREGKMCKVNERYTVVFPKSCTELRKEGTSWIVVLYYKPYKDALVFEDKEPTLGDIVNRIKSQHDPSIGAAVIEGDKIFYIEDGERTEVNMEVTVLGKPIP